MNIQIPSHEEIQVAFKKGEANVVALFDKVSQQIVELAEQLAKQAEIIKALQAKAAKKQSKQWEAAIQRWLWKS